MIFLSACMFIRERPDFVLGILQEIITKGKNIWKLQQFDYNHGVGDRPFVGSGEALGLLSLPLCPAIVPSLCCHSSLQATMILLLLLFACATGCTLAWFSVREINIMLILLFRVFINYDTVMLS